MAKVSTITVNKKEYVLPTDENQKAGALNHLMLCLHGKKTHMKFKDKYGDETSITSFMLQDYANNDKILLNGNVLNWKE